MENSLSEASLPNRPALKEITDNAPTQQKATTKKQSLADLNTCGGDDICDISAEVDEKITADKFEVQQETKKPADKSNEEVKYTQLNSTTGSTTTLPDIVNVQPIIVTDEADDSIITSLTKNLNNLQIDSRGYSTLTIPTSTCDAVSSDDEIFTECQPYGDQSASLGSDINRSIHWDTVVSTVSSSNLENIENTIEQQADTNDLDQQQESIINSDTRNTDINPSHILESCGYRAEVGTFNSIDSTLKSTVEIGKLANLNKTVDLKSICKEALSIGNDDENFDLTSSVPTLNITETESKNSSKNSPIEETQLIKTKTTEQNNDKVTLSLEVATAIDCKTNDSLLREPNFDSSAVRLDMLEKSVNEISSSREVYTSSDKSLAETPLLNHTATMSKSPSKEVSNLNQITTNPVSINQGEKMQLMNPLNANESRQFAGGDGKQLEETNLAISKSPNSGSLFGELNGSSDENTSEALNATINIASADKTFDANDLITDTLDEKRLEVLNQTIDITSSLDKDLVNEDSKSHQDITVDDMNRTIELNKMEGNLSVEPMEIDTYSPIRSESITAKCTMTTCPDKSVISQAVFVDSLTNPMDVTFKTPSIPSTTAPIGKIKSLDEPSDSDFEGHGLILNPSDFDFLLTKGNNNTVQIDDRNSLLLRFDPLVRYPPVPVNQTQINNHSQLAAKALVSTERLGRLSPAVEEDDEELCSSNSSKKVPTFAVKSKPEREPLLTRRIHSTSGNLKKDDKMSVDVIQGLKIENDAKSQENISPKADQKKQYKMDDLEKKIKNEVLKTEDIEKKLKDAEQREEALLKRITEKDKTISKMSGVIEAYEKAIAELIAEKEQIIQNYERQMSEIKSERDLNYQHLTSLETTFSDLHVKYERSKQLTSKLKSSEEDLKAEKKQNVENLRLQEQRYEKMKNHAMQQLEIANNKLESLTRNHSMEVTRLKALLKKEEISRLSITEQLQQKSRENEELMKICDELINGQGASS